MVIHSKFYIFICLFDGRPVDVEDGGRCEDEGRWARPAAQSLSIFPSHTSIYYPGSNNNNLQLQGEMERRIFYSPLKSHFVLKILRVMC